MPQIGDIVLARSVIREDTGLPYVISGYLKRATCSTCGKQRWVSCSKSGTPKNSTDDCAICTRNRFSLYSYKRKDLL